MAYLKGNTVVDGALYVEGDIIYNNIRPDENGATITYKKDQQGIVEGRHLRGADSNTGGLIDSSIIETKPNNSNDVEVKFTWDNSVNQSPVNKITIKNSIDKLYVEDAALKAMNNSSTEVSDFNKYADTITSWSY